MKTIEQRAEEWGEYIAKCRPYIRVNGKTYHTSEVSGLTNIMVMSYIAGANKQKEIDDAELLKLKAKWEKEAQVNHDIDIKSIEERAKEAYPAHEYSVLERVMKRGAYVRGATEQQAIDDKVNYKQGFNDAIKTACNVFCHTGCPHKTYSYNCLNDKCDTWKIFKKMMEEDL